MRGLRLDDNTPCTPAAPPPPDFSALVMAVDKRIAMTETNVGAALNSVGQELALHEFMVQRIFEKVYPKEQYAEFKKEAIAELFPAPTPPDVVTKGDLDVRLNEVLGLIGDSFKDMESRFTGTLTRLMEQVSAQQPAPVGPPEEEDDPSSDPPTMVRLPKRDTKKA